MKWVDKEKKGSCLPNAVSPVNDMLVVICCKTLHIHYLLNNFVG